jgi:hypothetical protein
MTVYKFALTVDGEFVGSINIDDTQPSYPAYSAVFRSDPKVIEVAQDDPNFDAIDMGWNFDGTSWSPPVEE